ncbi:hypothetical protein [Halococcus sp. IIIV-5B]|uniref:hypothetical protein n=1 Tax=Halococcus sp. IIIV-5B TaxID=2321230 RepID=UPI000E756F30|nr:hypothetical protein [Halococcus sp. IIIV-5B]RJT03843.1 hypothetical protein D3261_10370 [Halococcus sp. IIIV-5B]
MTPRKGGGGQSPPDDEGGIVQTAGDEPINASLDRSVEYEEGEFQFIYGDIVHKEGEENPGNLVVVNLPDVVASRWQANGGTWSTEDPTYRPEDQVVIVVPLPELDSYIPDWDEREEEIPRDQLEDDGITAFIYPGGKLDLIEPSHLRDS